MSNFYHRAARMLFPLVLTLALLPWRPALAQAAPPGAGVPNVYAQILTPATGATLSGQITIMGIAAALEFDHYEIYLTPANSLHGTLIAQGQDSVRRMGALATWNSADVPNGEYDLHLLVLKANRTYADSAVRGLTVSNLTAAAAPRPQPLPRPPSAAAGAQAGLTAPHTGDRLQGQIAIKGTAMHPAFARYELYAAPSGSNRWQFLSQNSYEVSSGVLWVWDTSTVHDATYDLRLRVVKQDSNYDDYLVSGVQVANQAAARRAVPAAADLVTATPVLPAPTPDISGFMAPASGAAITGNVAVRGAASAANFLRYDLHMAPAGATLWTWLHSGEAQVSDGILADWDTSALPDGRYDLRLRVVRQDGNYHEYYLRNLALENRGAGVQPAPSADDRATTRLLSGFITPVDGAAVHGLVSLHGSATDAHFSRYEVYAAPSGSERWSYVGGQSQALIEEELWRWDTTGWPDGQYDLRLRVVRADSNYNEYFVHNLAVRNGPRPGATATPTATPRAVSAVGPLPTPSLARSGISAPQAGATVSGPITIKGTATDPAFLRYELYVRPAGDAHPWWFLSATYDQVHEAALGVWDTALLADGRYDLRLRVVRRDSNYSEYFADNLLVRNGQTTAAPTVTPTAPPLPRATATPIPALAPAPGASISSPAPLSTVNGVVSIRGLAAHPQFQRYEVYITPVGRDEWVFLSMGGSPAPANGELLRWDSASVPNGRYDLRLRVVHQDGNYDEAVVSNVTVANAASRATNTPVAPVTSTPAARATNTPAPTVAAPQPTGSSPRINQPQAQARLSGVVTISGAAHHAQFVRYELWVAKTTFPGAQDWQLMLTGSQPVNSGVLGAWNTGAFADGLYDLRLRVVKEDGNYDEVIVKRLTIQNRPAS